MTSNQAPASAHALARLVEQVGKRLELLDIDDRGAYVGSEFSAIDRVLSRIRSEGLSRGPVFCEWGSGLGGVCGVANLNGFTPLGIEINGHLVDSARALAEDLNLAMVFAEGTYLLPGDEDLAGSAVSQTQLSFGNAAWDEMDLTPSECDVTFAYPWPGEESFVDSVFSRHAGPDSLLMTFHDFDHVLVQRKIDQEIDLLPLGWM